MTPQELRGALDEVERHHPEAELEPGGLGALLVTVGGGLVVASIHPEDHGRVLWTGVSGVPA